MPDLKMPKINNVQIAGNLTRDPEASTIGSGTALCKFGLAYNSKYTTKSGEQKEDTIFVDITVWGKAAEWCGQKLKKGYPVLVDGELTMDTWNDRDSGEKRSKFGIKANRVQGLTWENANGNNLAGGGTRNNEPETADDDMPF